MHAARPSALVASLGLGLSLAAVPAGAQERPVSASPIDTASIWTMQGENDSLALGENSDRYYTSGLRLNWTSGTQQVPGFLDRAGRAVFGDGQMRVDLGVSQQIYTAADTSTPFPARTDRPYAGVLLLTGALSHQTQAASTIVSLGVGMVGPAALGEKVQNGFHDLIGEPRAQGWDTQLHDQPLVQLTASRTWRVPIARLGVMETDMLPQVTGAAGLMRVYGMLGGTLRIGQGLDADFGPSRIRPGLSGGDAFRPTRDFGWYVFAGAAGQAVAYDVTLNGNAWTGSRRVDLNPLVGEMQFGFAVIVWGMRLTYTQVFQTQEFRHQKAGLHQFGSLALSVRW